MKKELIQEYTARISQSNRSGLVVINYEIILSYIEEALELHKQNKLMEFQEELKKARKFVNELMGCLDFQYEISLQLIQLYLFINKVLIRDMIRKSTEDLEGIQKVIHNLHEAFTEVSAQDQSGAVMQNSQQVYAGLTYGRGMLNESYDMKDLNRGFKA